MPVRSLAAIMTRMLKNTDSASLTERLDESVRPQDDFFEYVNASWIKAHPIPNSESGWEIGRAHV